MLPVVVLPATQIRTLKAPTLPPMQRNLLVSPVPLPMLMDRCIAQALSSFHAAALSTVLPWPAATLEGFVTPVIRTFPPLTMQCASRHL